LVNFRKLWGIDSTFIVLRKIYAPKNISILHSLIHNFAGPWILFTPISPGRESFASADVDHNLANSGSGLFGDHGETHTECFVGFATRHICRLR
jgi:hypothetical protein